MILESVIAGGIALYDVSHLLLSHPTKSYPKRPVDGIRRIYHHHSGALGRAGFEGALGTSRYVTERLGWPGFPYHFFLAVEPDVDEEGRLIVLRGQPDYVRSYHTGSRANTHGLSICWQGNLSRVKPSFAQVEMAEALCAWLDTRDDLSLSSEKRHSFHSEAGQFGGKAKPACPGPHVEAWVKAWRS